MNYIKQLNAFYSTLDFNPLSSNAIALYGVYLHIANKTNWMQEFRVANSTLLSKSGLNMSSLQRARNELVQKKYIEYKKRKQSNRLSKI